MLYGHERSRNPSRIFIKIDNSTLESLLSDTELSLPLEVMIGACLSHTQCPVLATRLRKLCKLPWQVHTLLEVRIHVVTWG
jgi:hypothetical protein